MKKTITLIVLLLFALVSYSQTKTSVRNTDSQKITNFSIINNILSLTIENGGTRTVNLTPYIGGSGGTNQQLTFNPTTNILSLENGGTVDLSSLINNTETDPTAVKFDPLNAKSITILKNGDTPNTDVIINYVDDVPSGSEEYFDEYVNDISGSVNNGQLTITLGRTNLVDLVSTPINLPSSSGSSAIADESITEAKLSTNLRTTIANKQESLNTTATTNAKAYYILPSDFEFTTANLAQYAGYILEIKHNFNLQDQNVNLPNQTSLFFTGGSLSNFRVLTGNYSSIKLSSEYQIFYFDRSVGVLKGFWLTEKWNSTWFGSIADGLAVGGVYDTATGVFTIQQTESFDVQFSGTDNWDAIQKTLDAAFTTSVNKAFIPNGQYRVSKPLNMGFGGHSSLSLSGEGHYKVGDVTENNNRITGTYIFADHLEYALNVNGGYASEIKDIAFYGFNARTFRRHTSMWQNDILGRNFYPENIEDWNSNYVKKQLENSGYGLSKYKAYAGITTDLFIDLNTLPANTPKYDLPIPPATYTFTNGLNSTELRMERVEVTGFSVGIVMCAGNYLDNTDFYDFHELQVSSGIYGLANGSNQGRNTSINYSQFRSLYSAITDNRIGGSISTGPSYKGIVLNTSFDSCYQVIDVLNPQGHLTFINAYCENATRLGNWGSYGDGFRRNSLLTIENSLFRFTSRDTNPLGIPTSYFTGNDLKLSNTIIANESGVPMPILSRFLTIEDSRIRTIIGSNEINSVDNAILTSNFDQSSITYLDQGFDKNKLVYKNYGGKKYYLPRQWIDSNFDTNIVATNVVFDNVNRTLTMNYSAGSKDFRIGDIIGAKDGSTSFSVITEIGTNAQGNFLKSYVINGFRQLPNGTFVMLNSLTANSYNVIYRSRRFFDVPLKVINVNDRTLTLEEWDENLVVGTKIDPYYPDGIRLVEGFFSQIDAIDPVLKTITLRSRISVLRSGYIYGYIKPDAKDYWVEYPEIFSKF